MGVVGESSQIFNVFYGLKAGMRPGVIVLQEKKVVVFSGLQLNHRRSATVRAGSRKSKTADSCVGPLGT
jgi:hypothetical protein